MHILSGALDEAVKINTFKSLGPSTDGAELVYLASLSTLSPCQWLWSCSAALIGLSSSATLRPTAAVSYSIAL